MSRAPDASPIGRREVMMLIGMLPEKRKRFIDSLSPIDLLAFDVAFEAWAHDSQLPPPEGGWRTWLMMAGRGFGKTRAGAEWVTGLARGAGRPVRIALVGATVAEVRSVMIEGESGLIAVARGRRPRWEPSNNRLVWANGSEAHVFSAEAYEALRGPQHHFAWCDELAKWSNAEKTWDNLQLGLRAGDRPRALITTTPRPIRLIEKLRGLPGFVETGGRTDENISLPESFVEAMAATYAGTRVARQEMAGEYLKDVEGALWTRALLERSRSGHGAALELTRVVIGVDPPAGAGPDSDACGIVAAGLGADGAAYVLGDHSVQGRSPEGWAGAVAAAYAAHGADRVIAEANQGGAMVASVLRAAEPHLPLTLVHASRGKTARAEPVAALFETGRARLAGEFEALESELAGMAAGGGYHGPGRSPDRADAMVWALWALMLDRAERVPRVRLV